MVGYRLWLILGGFKDEICVSCKQQISILFRLASRHIDALLYGLFSPFTFRDIILIPIYLELKRFSSD
ncbi:hypothetical protein GDO81_020803 [Engystomops pustulosus]|uniref:Uncharacterized protein n=1 Tax=Engystomops pustulosus TaxID=76066 RepID=A0AAV6YWF3_ENGPU|nr:hypothetical protein GDO81_020803 [Engystomops pustulosus]